MASRKVADLPELFRSDDARWASRAAGRGEIRRVARGLYTANLDEPLEQLLRRRWMDAVRLVAPGAVVVDRSAARAAPEPDGVLFVDTGPAARQPRAIELPGLSIRPRPGPGPVAGDMPLGPELWLSSEPRIALDNLVPSRGRTTIRRTFTRAELEEWIDRRATHDADRRLNEIRDGARSIAGALHATEQFAALDRMIGQLLGTRDDPAAGPTARARAAGLAVDRTRLALFETLRAALAQEPPRERPATMDPLRLGAFYEAYFSNWIEGTEFEVAEAHAIVFDGRIPVDRPADAHDIAGTFNAVTTEPTRSTGPLDSDALEAFLQEAHRRIMVGRPDQRPGVYKERPNRAGNTLFVAPSEVRGTLREAAALIATLPPGFPRAAMAMFVASEIHPFGDGNGRTARLLMNAYLSDAEQTRVLIPLVFRDEYLAALRAMSANSQPAPLTKVLDRAQLWGFRMDWTGAAAVDAQLQRSNALVTPDRSALENLHLLDPETGLR